MTAHAEGERGGGGGEGEYQTHVTASLVPRVFLLDRIAWRDASEREQVAGRMAAEMPFQEWESDLPILTLEGTNWCTPLQAPLALYVRAHALQEAIRRRQLFVEAARKKIEQDFPAFETLAFQIGQSNISASNIYDVPLTKFSPFYRFFLGAWVDMRRWGVYDIFDVTLGAETGASRVFGVDFRDWVARAKSVCLWPTFRVQKEELATIQSALAEQPPVHSLGRARAFLDISQASGPYQDHALWQQLADLCSSLSSPGKNDAASSGVSKGSEVDVAVPLRVTFRINREEKITDKLLQQLRVLLQKKQRYSVRRFDCRRFNLSAHDRELYVIELVFELEKESK